jgi:(2R)-sulfolactate sulfo-lyase subunit alpha
MSEIPHLLVHDHQDSVGVVVIEGLEAGTDMLVCVTHDNSTFRLAAGEAAPIGHKIALKALNKGDTVFKYGEDIGVMTADVKKGDHLHTQNCKTKRW